MGTRITQVQRTVTILVLAASSAGFGSTPATAQEADQDLAEVVVTGSRVRGVAPVGSAIIQLSTEQIEQQGATSTSDVLRSIPQIAALGAIESLGGSGVQGAAANVTRSQGINLRGVGPNTTLGLFDSQRVVSGGTMGQLLDASTFPQIAIQRIEVVANGASAIYGSDAITGVVNIIPRKSMDGAEVRARYSFADNYDEHAYGGALGHSWGSGSVFLAVENSGHGPLFNKDRSFIVSDQRSRGGQNNAAFACDAGSVTVGGQTYNFPGGNNAPTTGQFTLVNAATSRNTCDNLSQYGQLMIDTNRNSGFLYITQEVSEGVELYLEAFGTSRKSFQRSGVFALNNTSVPATNAFFRSPTNTGPITVSSLLNEFPFYNNPVYAKGYQFNGGVKFKLPNSWNGSVTAAFGDSDDYTRSRNANNAVLTAALASNNPATALNPFGGNDPSRFPDLFTSIFWPYGHSQLKVADASFDGPAFELPGGAVRVAAGVEYREEFLDAGLSSGTVSAPVKSGLRSSRNNKSVFAEVFVPVVSEANALPGVRALDLSLAGRYERYSDFGSTTNPRIGVNWTVVNGLRLHASYGTSFRAPQLVEANDRSAGWGVYPVVNFRDPLSPTGFSSGISIAGGNSQVQPESATTWSFGFDLEPAAVQGLRVGVNYFRLTYEDQITALQGNNTVLLNSFYADKVIRNPTPAQLAAALNLDGSPRPVNGILPSTIDVIIDGRRNNQGLTKFSGLDFDVTYNFDTDVGRFNVGANATKLLTLRTAPTPTAPLVSQKGNINWPAEFRARAQAGWRNGALSVNGFINFTNSYTNNLVTPIFEVASFTTLDLNASYDMDALGGLGKGLRLSVNVNNALDKDPPFSNSGFGYDPQMASAIGRTVVLSLNKTF